MKRKLEETKKKTEDQPHFTRPKSAASGTGPSSSSSSSSPLICTIVNTDPEYGSQEYWENRYTKNNGHQSKRKGNKSDSNSKSIIANDGNKNDNDNDDDASLGHEWYFTYEDLKSLLLPLVLGGRGEEFDQWSDDGDETSGDEGDMWEEVEDDESDERDGKKPLSSSSSSEAAAVATCQKKTVDGDGDKNVIEGETVANRDEEGSNDGVNDYVDIYKAIANENNTPPKRVLEVGCGDVPLGHGLCEELLHLQGTVGINANRVVEKIICFDYSKNVIDLLVNQQNGEKGSNAKGIDEGNDLAVQFEVLDARNLPYMERYFDLIIDKGTLDAMLSDKNEGVQNCVKIISEASRLLVSGGYLLIVSHLNACDSEGLSWVEEVLLTGLRRGDKISDWRIEVHSNDENDVSDEEDDEKDSGPAVYIIQKVAVPDNKAKLREDCQDTSKASIKFFGY